jgi:hypothetical protein
VPGAVQVEPSTKPLQVPLVPLTLAPWNSTLPISEPPATLWPEAKNPRPRRAISLLLFWRVRRGRRVHLAAQQPEDPEEPEEAPPSTGPYR